MKRLLLFILIAGIAAGCRNGDDQQKNYQQDSESRVLVAGNIIYDVVVIPEAEDDEWESERLKGYRGDEMVDALFEAVYSKKAVATDYFSGEKIKPSRLRDMEATDEYRRSDIAKLQFTENWYFNPETLEIEKEVISIVPGYRYSTGEGDITATGYRALLAINLR
ncbi:MAG: hypothetical protein LC649_02755 [Bacteroidales bacterium]|nr:hypothetical protein [Bacteroidales bacterium]